MQQTVNINSSIPHTISSDVNVTIIQDDVVLVSSTHEATFQPLADQASITIIVDEKPSFIQLEPLPYKTSYIPTGTQPVTRDAGYVYIPYSFGQTGAIIFWFKPYSHSTQKRTLLSSGDVTVTYDDDFLYVNSNEFPCAFGEHNITIAWRGNTCMLDIDGTHYNFEAALNFGSSLLVGTGEINANGYIRDLYLYDHAEIDGKYDKYYPFNGSVSESRGTIIETPIPNRNHAPVIVQKADGTPLTRVAFPNNETYAMQTVVVNDSNDFEIPFEYIETRSFTTVAKAGSEILPIKEIYKNHIVLDIDPADYNGQKITLIYQPQDAYTVIYGDTTMTIKIASHDGSDLTITYESDDIKLLPNNDLNSAHNPNHSGFLYLTHDLYQVENINMTMYPAEIKAGQTAFIAIDTKDAYGNIVTDADVSVVCSYGEIIPIEAAEQPVPISEQAGRYMFKYISPLINASIDGYIVDKITVTVSKDYQIQAMSEYDIKIFAI